MPMSVVRETLVASLITNDESRFPETAMEAPVTSIDTLTSYEAQEPRSIRNLAPSEEYLNEAHRHTHDHTTTITPQERLLSEIECFRVLALEKLESSLEAVIERVAHEVLSRELSLAPSDLQVLIQRALRRYEREGPIRLRVAPQDVSRVETLLPVVADSSLENGDLVVEVCDGEVESRMHVRLSCAVGRLQQSTTQYVTDRLSA